MWHLIVIHLFYSRVHTHVVRETWIHDIISLLHLKQGGVVVFKIPTSLTQDNREYA